MRPDGGGQRTELRLPWNLLMNSLTGRLDNATKNLYEAASAGANHQATGYLVTDWGIMVIIKPCPLAIPDLYSAHQQVGTQQVPQPRLAQGINLVFDQQAPTSQVESSRWVNFPN